MEMSQAVSKISITDRQVLSSYYFKARYVKFITKLPQFEAMDCLVPVVASLHPLLLWQICSLWKLLPETC